MPLIEERISVSVDTILLATDFSPASQRAASYAKGLARLFCSTVEIAHVFDPSAVNSYNEAILGLSLLEREQDSNERLDRLKADFASSGVKSRLASPQGHRPAAELLNIAAQDTVDLIVSGTRSKIGIERMLLGSIAEQLVRNAPCPVLTVGPKAAVPREGSLSFTRILFATDFSEQAAKAAALALAFAQDSGAHLYFCHVLASYASWEQEAPLINDPFETALRKLIPGSSYDWCSPEVRIEHGEAAKGILTLAEKLDADLIVVGARKGDFYLTHLERGVTVDLLAEAACPVLTVC